jgi:WD40 repeat protein
MVRVYTTKTDDANDAEYTLVGSPVRVDNDDADEATPSPVVGVHVHPTGTFVVATCQSGRVVVCSLEHPHSVDKVAAFSSPTQTEEDYTCTALHPDGLILCAGTSKGAIRIWDLKGGTIAGSLSVRFMTFSLFLHLFEIIYNGAHDGWVDFPPCLLLLLLLFLVLSFSHPFLCIVMCMLCICRVMMRVQ